jgi:hypothetical protein
MIGNPQDCSVCCFCIVEIQLFGPEVAFFLYAFPPLLVSCFVYFVYRFLV